MFPSLLDQTLINGEFRATPTLSARAGRGGRGHHCGWAEDADINTDGAAGVTPVGGKTPLSAFQAPVQMSSIVVNLLIRWKLGPAIPERITGERYEEDVGYCRSCDANWLIGP
ncbi:MAG: hypothetical protein QOJ15_3420 [Bradyrhizobium sp.]|jgi:hypothetical protein|nr:hypothetical protein [Bradyrhizobium sp.]